MNSNGKLCIFLRISILTLSINLMIEVHCVRNANAQEKCDEVELKVKNYTFGGQYLKNEKLGPVSSASISPDGKMAVIGTRSDKFSQSDKKLEQNLVVVNILETKPSNSGSKLVLSKEISVKEGINSIAFHPSGKYFAVAFQSTIDIFDINHLDRKLSTIRTQQINIKKIGFSADGKTLFSLDKKESSDSLRQNKRDIVLYQFNSNANSNVANPEILGKEMQIIGSESKNQYTDVVFHPASQHLIIGGDDREDEFIKVYSMDDKKHFSVTKSSSSTKSSASPNRLGIVALSISQDGKYISSVNQSQQREVIIWNSTDLSQLSIKKRIPTIWPVLSTAFSPNSQYLLVGEETLTSGHKCYSPVSLRSIADEEPRFLSFRHGKGRKNEPVRIVLFGPDKKSIFFGSNDGFFNYLELDQIGQKIIN